MKHMMLLAAMAIGLFGCTGCGSGYIPATGTSLAVVQSETFDLPARELYEKIKSVITAPPLSLAIEQEKQGVIVTGYKEGYEGELHVARRWEERTRYRIAVIPDFDEPAGKSRIEISDHTQTRSNSRAGWEGSLSLHRPQRSQELLETIRKAVK